MKLIIKNTKYLKGRVTIPGSKSLSIRALFIATLAKGTSEIHGVLEAQDTQDAINVCEILGAKIQKIQPACHGFCVQVEGNGTPLKIASIEGAEISTGNSGLTTHFTLPLLGLRKNPSKAVSVDCGQQMRKRNITPLLNSLRDLGMTVTREKKNGWPILISEELKGGKTTIEGSNSQYVSALLLACACAKKDTTIIVKNMCERPFIDMTLFFLNQQKIIYTHEQRENEDIFFIKGVQRYTKYNYTVPGDFSSAAFFIGAQAIIPGNINIQGLKMNDLQGDKKILTILQSMKSSKDDALHGTTIDLTDTPDLLPILAVIATQAHGVTHIKNITHARNKETDRVHSMVSELKKMGAKITVRGETMTIRKSALHGTQLNGYHDHRTIMALAIAAMVASGKSTIENADGIEKTFPTFLKLMQKIGGNVVEESEKNIILIGFKHAGKSTIGEKLGMKLKLPFVDLDEEIEHRYTKKTGKIVSFRDIMVEHGERYFRGLESEVLKSILEKNGRIILATGGGTPLKKANQSIMAHNTIVYIRSPIEHIQKRIAKSGQPAFYPGKVKSPEKQLKKLLKERHAIYTPMATIRAKNDTTIGAVVEEIIKKLSRKS